MICFDVFLNGEKLCRAGKKELVVLTTHVSYVEPKYEDDDPITLTVGGLFEHPEHGDIHPRWIPRRPVDTGDEITFRIIESETADEPLDEEIPDPGWRENSERKSYEFLKAKFEGPDKGLEMSSEHRQRIPQLLDVATFWLDDAAQLAAEIDRELRGNVVTQLGAALGSILEAKVMLQNGSDGQAIQEPEPDGPMSPQQQDRVDQLTDEEIQAIDQALLANASHEFRKIARVVGSLMMYSTLHKKGIPDIFYADRIRHLVATGRFESQGNLASMRSAEVRLPNAEKTEG